MAARKIELAREGIRKKVCQRSSCQKPGSIVPKAVLDDVDVQHDDVATRAILRRAWTILLPVPELGWRLGGTRNGIVFWSCC